MNAWNNIYEQFNPIAFNLFGINVHWYGMMYVLALLSALFIAKWIVKHDKIPVGQKTLDDYFIYIEIGIILGARLGYVLFYDNNTSYYMLHPWQIFNPFNPEGEFVGIRGMSYHGAVIGWFLGSLVFHYRHKEISFGMIMDIVAVAVPMGFIFGRIGNFLNQELVGKVTDVPWGIVVDGVLRHPSQLYEGVLEGLVVFLVIYFYRPYKRFSGELILVYGFMYGSMRFLAEFWRQPDVQLGYLAWGWLTMGQVLSFLMMMTAVGCWLYFDSKKRKQLSK